MICLFRKALEQRIPNINYERKRGQCWVDVVVATLVSETVCAQARGPHRDSPGGDALTACDTAGHDILNL